MSITMDEVLGRRVLIYGEVGVGKTKLLAHLTSAMIRAGHGGKITIIDMAPKKMGAAGGVITEYMDVGGLRYLRPETVYAPRLQACNADDVKRYVESNIRNIERVLKIYEANPTEILVINDLSIYLHGRTAEELVYFIEKSGTFLGSSYYGRTLEEDYGSGISQWERMQVEKLIRWVDRAIFLD
jgi:energy-coupling factor transporter ATP-binding protein EcfA2